MWDIAFSKTVTRYPDLKELRLKIFEALLSALPVTAIVYILSLTPLFNFSGTELIAFTIGALMLIIGIGLFNMGADLAMTPIGTNVGAGLSKQKKLFLLLAVCFILGLLITIAEPDLQVLAEQVSSVMNGTLLIYTVGLGVGMFLVVAVLRIIFHKTLSNILMLFYMLLFALALLLAVNDKLSLLPLAFDSGGVTTGPITVPFIMALGVGISSVLGDKNSSENSFGLVALCSVGPIMAVLLLGIFSQGGLTYSVPDYSIDGSLATLFASHFVHTSIEVAKALGLIVLFFIISQLTFLHLSKRKVLKIVVGVIFTYIGLVLFLTGVNAGFMPIGYKIGYELGEGNKIFLTVFSLAVGVLVVLAEPAIHVLNQQVEDVTGGYISKKSMILGLCIGVGASIALSVIRIIFDFSVVYYIIPGYFISLALSLFVPPIYTAIAFDSGGVASGPMTSGFILPFATGVCVAIQGADAVLRDAFGVVALVAMTPLITIQLLGFRGVMKERIAEHRAMRRILDADDQQIIDFL
ncbi:MAG: DUF1538 domain-containing protein [Ruminococcaceae bacterium]|nr:DUF1538 domain-containing protein [Oscillospiraceae bacterium]